MAVFVGHQAEGNVDGSEVDVDVLSVTIVQETCNHSHDVQTKTKGTNGRMVLVIHP